MQTQSAKIEQAVRTLLSANLDARNGLPENLFLLVSALTPIPNVDLLIRDKKGRILLSWRDDPYYGKGWHIPGGCVRFGETMAQRLQRTAVNELGCEVTFDPEPLTVRDVLRGPRPGLVNPDIRGHNITILFQCSLPEEYRIDNRGRAETDPGYLRWFDKIPENLLRVHDVYKEFLYGADGKERHA